MTSSKLYNSISSQHSLRLSNLLIYGSPLQTSPSSFAKGNALSLNTLENASKTFLVKYRKENPQERISKIDQIFRSGRMKDLHDNNNCDACYWGDDKCLFRKKMGKNKKENMKNKIERFSRELSEDVMKEITGNRRPFSYGGDGREGRDLDEFLSTSPTNYKRRYMGNGYKKNEDNEVRNYFTYKGENGNRKIKGIQKKYVFQMPKWCEIPKRSFNGYYNEDDVNIKKINKYKGKKSFREK